MGTFADAFPRYAKLSVTLAAAPSQPEFSWDNTNAVESLVGLVAGDQNAIAADLDALDSLSLALYDDLQAQRLAAELSDLPAIDFFQFWLSVSPLASASGRRRFSMARDWGARALLDSYDDTTSGQLVRVNRLREFGKLSDPALRVQVLQTLLAWTTHFFYMAWATGDHIAIARLAAPILIAPAFGVLTSGPQYEELADDALAAAISLVRWLDRYEPLVAAPLATILGQFEDRESYPEAPRCRVALLLAGPQGLHTPMPPAARAVRALARYGHLLEGHERLFLVSASFGGRPEDAHGAVDVILQAIDEYAATMSDFPLIDRMYDRGRLFGQVGGLVRTLAVSGYVDEAVAVLARWYGVSSPREDLIVLLAADPDGTRWITEDRIVPEEGSCDLVALIGTCNRALGQQITAIDGLDEGMPAAIERLGIPNFDAAAEYERACVEHLRFEGLSALGPEMAGRAIVSVPGLPVPLGALALRTTGAAHPLAVSLRSPLPDRVVRRVVLWASQLAASDEEADAVSAVFKSQGVHVERPAAPPTVAGFKALYEREDVDVIWVTSHGEQAMFRPEQSTLTLGEGVELTLDQLLTFRQPVTDHRRLVVLNACDSGSSAQFGGIAEFGLGSAIAGPTQAVIGHMWPIGFIDAAGFGVLIAVMLARGESYLLAYAEAALALRVGCGSIADALRAADVSGPILDRLDAAALHDPERGILHWGSPVFLE